MHENLKNFSSLKISLLLACLLFSAQTFFVAAQTGDDLDKLKVQAALLMKAQKYTEALPVLEKIVKADPKDADMELYYGFALLGQSKNEADAAKAKSFRARARAAFVKSKELGNNEPIIAAMIQGIPPDGGDEKAFSNNAEADKFMAEGEKAFSNGNLDLAFENYQKALKLDPNIYEAALFSGDVNVQKGDFAQAEIWYQKAIAINPNRETAYRFSATPLMKQKKYEQARDRYIEAFITEPYNSASASGLTQWGQATGAQLGHPRIDVPEFKMGENGKSKSTITLNSLMDGSGLAWISYSTTRTEWQDGKFAKTFPNEKNYRHTLQEEAEALRSVIKTAKELKDKKKPIDPQIAALMKLDEEGLLESYILLALPDRDIAEDHPEYLKNNRDKLRRYVAGYVIHPK